MSAAHPSTTHSEAAREFGQRVRELRHGQDMTQEQLAEAAGLHWTYVGQVERGLRNISLTNIIKIAYGLGTDPGDLVRGLPN